MDLIIGAAAGCILTAGIWWTSQRFLRHFAAEAEQAAPQHRLLPFPAPLGEIPILLALVQVAIAFWGAYVFWRTSSTPHAVAGLVVTALLVTVALIDFQLRRIPDLLCLGLAGWGAVQMIWLGRPTPRSLALGVLVGGGLFLLIALAGQGAMGDGDVKLVAALGAVLGYPLVLRGMFWGIVATGLAALFLLATGRAGRKDTMAYGPYLALGAWLVWSHSMGLWP